MAKPRLIAIDGIDAATVVAAARRTLEPAPRGGISRWDASGVFQELAMAEQAAGAPSPRTLLLLYAADLAFRLRWEIRPALAEGYTVAAAPYVETAMAFGRAAGIPVGWLTNLFRFAPRPSVRRFVATSRPRLRSKLDGFVGFGCEMMGGTPGGRSAREIMTCAESELRLAARRWNCRK